MSSTVTLTPPPAQAGALPATASHRWRWVVFIVLLAAFGALAITAHSVPYFPIDLAAARAVQGLPAPWFHTLLVAVSWPGFPPQVYIFVVIVSAAFYFTHQKREAVFLLLSSVAIATLSQGIKLLVDRPRPPASLIHVLIPNLNGGRWSFPAGHVESFVVIFGFIAFVAYTRWQRPTVRLVVLLVCGVMIALIGLSRIDSGEHWLSDTVGGYLLSSAFLLAMFSWYTHRRAPLASRPIAAPPV